VKPSPRQVAFSLALALVLCASAASAQTTVSLPDTSQTTALTVNVSEQVRVVVPAGITFNVTDVGSSTAASAASITIDQIVLASATKQLRISAKADASSFTPPAPGDATWSASDVTWNAAAWTAAAGSAGTLSSAAFGTVATCDANTVACATTALILTLGAKTSVQRAGTHTLTVTWKFESIGS
jgi:hypothetical protein